MGLFINCKENTRLVTRSMDFPISFKDRLAMRIHLFVCDNCARFVKQMNQIHDWLHTHETENPDDILSDEAKDRIRSRLVKSNPGQGE